MFQSTNTFSIYEKTFLMRDLSNRRLFIKMIGRCYRLLKTDVILLYM